MKNSYKRFFYTNYKFFKYSIIEIIRYKLKNTYQFSLTAYKSI